MSLLSVTVKKARFVCDEAEHFNSYVALKLQNVKSTTVTVKGANPCWEQDFLFETNDMNTGLLVEVWSKGIIWDRLLGYYFIPLSEVSYMNEEASGQWVSLDSELEMRGAEVIGTKKPTGHSLLIDCRFELPFDPENTEAADLQRKLEMLNKMMDQEARAEQTRRQILYNIGHSGYSEDSDYTSDLNYPVGGQGANSSASQFRAAANQLATPQRSLETSRENSYERDDHQIPATAGGRLAAGNYGSYGGSGHSPRYNEPYPEEGPPQRYSQSQHASESSEPLFYNSRPRHYKEYRRRKHTWDYEDSQDGWYSEGYDYHDTRINDTWGYSDTEYYPSTTSSRRRGPHRRPSLERQMTLYDDHSYYSDGYSNDGRVGKMSSTYPECETDIRYNEFYDTTTGYGYQDERYGQDDEDRQWDSGGNWYSGSTYYENKRNRKTLPQRPASSIGIHRPDYRPTVIRQRSYESEELDYSGHPTRRRKPLPQQRPTSRQEGTGKKLPPTPTKPSNVIIGRKLASLPATPSRQLPKTRTPSEESYYKSDYNEDYNYAYRSQDNLPQHTTYADTIYGDQSGYDQVPVTGKTTRYPEVSQDNQYGSSYVAPVDEKYSHSYQEPQTQETYDQTYAQNSYGEDYHQQSYAQQNTRAYQETYQDTIYPNASQPNDQYAAQPKDRYDKTTTGGSVIIDDNYPPIGYEQNNVQYQDTYKQDTYQNQYTDYPVTVPSSVYDQNNVTNTFNQYPQEPYDSQYNINTSTAYQNTYQDAYPQDTYNQEKYNQETYGPDKYNQETYPTQDKYNQDTFVQDKYDQEPYSQDKYNQEPYSQDKYKQEPYSQDKYNQEPYSQDKYSQEPYKQTTYKQEPLKQDVYQQEPYKQDIYQQEPYKQDTYQQEPYKQDTYQQESYKQDTYQQDSYKQDTYQQDTYQQDTYQQDTYQQDTYQQDAYQPDAYQQDAYQQDAYQQDTYQQDTYRQDTYPPDSYQQETYKQEAYKQDTYKQDAYKQDTYKQDTYKQDTYKQDTYTQDTYKQDTYQQDAYQQDTYNQDTYKQDTYKQDGYKQDSYKQDTYIQDTYSQDKYNQDTYGQDAGQDSYQGSFEESYKESPVPSGERRTSEVPELSVTTPRGKTRTNGYQSSESDYYYPCQESQDVSPVGMSRRKKLSKREASPLIQQNTDSLESRDDELKDSFETAVSSVSSSIAKKGYSEYSTAGDSSPAAPTLTDSPQSVAQPATTMVNHVTSNHVTSNMTVTAIVHATTTSNGKRLSRTESYQEDMLEDEEYLPEIIPKEPQRKDSQLSHQSQLSQHSSQHSQHSQHSQKPKLTRGDSYASDHFPEESYSRRSSYAQPTRKDSFSSTTQEAFKPPLTRTDSYQKRGSYSQNYTTPPPLSRTDSYQRGYFKEQESIEETEALSTVVNGEYKMREDSIERYERKEDGMIRSSRENSLADTYKTTPPLSQTDSPRGSITKQASLEESVQMDVPPRSPPEPPADNEILDIVGAAPVPTQLKERPEMTARQRWHWAYNQIIMQLNVSSLIYSPFTGILSIRHARSLVAGESYLRNNASPLIMMIGVQCR